MAVFATRLVLGVKKPHHVLRSTSLSGVHEDRLTRLYAAPRRQEDRLTQSYHVFTRRPGGVQADRRIPPFFLGVPAPRRQGRPHYSVLTPRPGPGVEGRPLACLPALSSLHLRCVCILRSARTENPADHNSHEQDDGDEDEVRRRHVREVHGRFFLNRGGPSPRSLAACQSAPTTRGAPGPLCRAYATSATRKP
jgi:hypothetical protein